MDAADYDFARISEFDMKELRLFESVLQQCGKKRLSVEDTDKGVGETVKKARMAGPVKIGREEAARYWQSLIVAGRELGIKPEEMKAEARNASPHQLRSLKLEVKPTKTPPENEAFLAAMRAKVNLLSQTMSTSTAEVVKFDCILCDKTFTTKTSLGQHIAAKHVQQ